MQRFFSARPLFFVFVFFAATFAVAQPADDFTIAALPDTQFYAKTYPQIFAAQTRWILDNAAAQNIKLVVGLGDIVDGGGELYEWQNANAAYSIIDRKIPFLPTIGNHDYDRNNPSGRTDSTTNYNTYFGPSRFTDRNWYRSSYPYGSNENFYATFTFGSKNYLFVVLEVFPRDVSLQWAASVIQKYPTYDAIIVTHAYTFADNTRLDRCDENSAATFAVGQDNDGEQIWQKLVSKFPNIVMVLSGHVVEGDGTGRRSDFGDNGNLVNQMLSDYQGYPNGGNGYLRLISVSPSKNTISVKTYSPYLDQYLTDDHNQFTMIYKRSGSTGAQSGTISGVVKNIYDCSRMSGVSVSSSPGMGSTASDGTFSIPASGPAAYSINVARQGFGVADNSTVAAVVPSQPSPRKVFLSTEGLLHGSVVISGNPIGNARVFVSGGALRTWTITTTQADGTFSAGWLPYGTYTVTATAPDGTTVQTSATVQTGNTTTTALSK